MLGSQTRSALQSIVTVVGGTKEQVVRISAANENVAQNVALITGLARTRNEVAEETSQAARTMRGWSERVERAIEGIASASEQSAASAEEVSASTQEQTAGVQELSAGAQELAALAARLREVVGAFELETDQADAQAA
jgi:methyl-accepting chemotaxis protein